MKHTIPSIIFTLLLAVFFGCQKGDTGPQGPAGPQGPVGPQGPQGNPGTTNVIYSDWLSTTAAEWKDTVMTNITQAVRVIKPASAITQPILDSGVMLVYLKDYVNTIYQLPFSYNINPVRVHNYIPVVGKIIFYEYATNGSGGYVDILHKYRYIIIRGTVKTNGRVRDWKQMSYEEVCNALNIPE